MEKPVELSLKDEKTQRKSNLELYRILVMLLIVAHHYVVNSGVTEAMYADPMSGNSIFLFLFGAWGKTGINCFVLISGYFMCKSRITLTKFLKLIGEVLFYRIIINMVFCVTGYAQFSLRDLPGLLLPIKSVDTGFISCYLLFFLFIPFLNVLVQNLSEKQHIYLMLLSLFAYSLMGSVPIFTVTMNYVSWFIVLYLIAAYIRLHPKVLFNKTVFWGWMTAMSVFASVLSVVVCAWLGEKIDREMAYFFLSDSNKVLAVLTAVCSFLFFKNVNLKQSKLINTISATTFGVLLIHANSDAMRQWLWQDLLKVPDMYASPWLIVHAIGSVAGIFVVCSAVDILRNNLVERLLLKLWDKCECKLVRVFRFVEAQICDRLHINQE